MKCVAKNVRKVCFSLCTLFLFYLPLSPLFSHLLSPSSLLQYSRSWWPSARGSSCCGTEGQKAEDETSAQVSITHTHSLSFGGRPCHYNTPSLSSTLHSQPPLEGCPCYYNTLSLKLGSQYIRRIAPSGSAVIASCHEDRNEFYPREAAPRDGTMRHIIVNLALLFTLPSSPGTSQQWRRRKEDGTLSSRLLHLSPPYGVLT